MRWSRLKVLAWTVWAVWAVAAGFYGDRFSALVWTSFVATFAVLEATALARRGDADPTLTEVIVRYIPGWLTFIVLGLVAWRLRSWLPDWVVFPAAAWGCWHFSVTYDRAHPLRKE